MRSHRTSEKVGSRNRQADNAPQVLELVLKGKAELAALDQDNGE